MKAIYRTLTYCGRCDKTMEHIRSAPDKHWACSGCGERLAHSAGHKTDEKPVAEKRANHGCHEV